MQVSAQLACGGVTQKNSSFVVDESCVSEAMRAFEEQNEFYQGDNYSPPNPSDFEAGCIIELVGEEEFEPECDEYSDPYEPASLEDMISDCIFIILPTPIPPKSREEKIKECNLDAQDKLDACNAKATKFANDIGQFCDALDGLSAGAAAAAGIMAMMPPLLVEAAVAAGLGGIFALSAADCSSKVDDFKDSDKESCTRDYNIRLATVCDAI